MSSASVPAVKKKKRFVATYMTPIFLWSVVRIQLRRPERGP
jgi:hypothetical protein